MGVMGTGVEVNFCLTLSLPTLCNPVPMSSCDLHAIKRVQEEASRVITHVTIMQRA